MGYTLKNYKNIRIFTCMNRKDDVPLFYLGRKRFKYGYMIIICMNEKKNEKKKFKAIKVPEDTYESLKDLKKLIVHKGLNSLNGNFKDYIPKKCPECGISFEKFELKWGYYRCPNCSFKYPKFKMGLGGSLALGGLIGLGVAGLIYLLTKNDVDDKTDKKNQGKAK
ncbi:MAG: hypothetical protein ACTSR8_13070 [Promethearchaeota archaeon]